MTTPTTCPVITMIGSVKAGPPCDEPATQQIDATCPRGHNRTLGLCDTHAAVISEYPAPKYCWRCYEEGRGQVPLRLERAERQQT
jgi:hypothetical protein